MRVVITRVALLTFSMLSMAATLEPVPRRLPLGCARFLGQSSRLDRLLGTAGVRYANDPEARKIAEAMKTKDHLEVRDFFSNLAGSFEVVEEGSLLKIQISTVRLAEESAPTELKAYGKWSESLNPVFSKFLIGVVMGAAYRIEKNPNLRKISVLTPVLNERLAYLLAELGFNTPYLGRNLTRDEIHSILSGGTLPQVYIDKIPEEIRTSLAHPNPNGGDKLALAIPFELEITL